MQTGHAGAAVELLRSAVAVSPGVPDYLNSLGNALGDAEQFEEAAIVYQRALALDSRHAIVTNNLGNVLKKLKRFDQSLAAYTRAIEIDPQLAPAHNGRAAIFVELRQFDQAIGAARQAIALDPNLADAWNNLGFALQETGRSREGVEALQMAARIAPNASDIFLNLGVSLQAVGRREEAVAAYRRATQLNPDCVGAYNNMGTALRDLLRIDEAIEALKKAIELRPDAAGPYGNLGIALVDRGDMTGCIAALQKSVELEPLWPDMHMNFAMMLLLAGDFERGWAEMEWRWKCDTFPSPRWRFPHPQWHGEPLNGKTLLIHAEQGLGDSIQFVRFARQAAERGARVIVGCPPELAELLGGAAGVHQVVATETLPPFDVHCPMMSLPLALGTRLETIPGERAYLRANPLKVEQWQQRLGPRDGRLRVGLVWAGKTTHADDHRRSIPLRLWAPLLAAQNVTFYSLQKGEHAAQLTEIGGAYPILDFTPDLIDFSQTAALIENLDLVICVDTSVAHLAAALGKPTWILVAARPDWRWLLHRDDSPWYPTVRLFRQQRLGDWRDAIGRAAYALNRLSTD